ncbi:hypothetical protein G3I76_60045, partial [Streptomyces sp. SID11233]|nr:hypothetical protein [Streptomyces sp. SID11233]
MPRRPLPSAPFTRGAWIFWTDSEEQQRHGQVVTQAPIELTWWVAPRHGDDHVLLRRQPCRSPGARQARDDALARGEQPYRYEVWTAAKRELNGCQRVRLGVLLGEAHPASDPSLPAPAEASALSKEATVRSTTTTKTDDLVRAALAARGRAATATARNIWTKERLTATPPCESDAVTLLRRLVTAQAAAAFWRHAKAVADEAQPTRVHADVTAWLVRR